jgi:hypothetical protein
MFGNGPNLSLIERKMGLMDAAEEGPFTDIFGAGEQFNLLTYVCRFSIVSS